MRGTIDLRRLRYFLAIADSGSISAAARAINLAQPALSYHIAELERLLGQPLFLRRREGVTLTDAGRLLQRHARDIVERVDAAERAFEKLGKRQAAPARVRVAVISSLAADLTPLLVARVGRDLPDVTLHIIEAGTRDIAHKLRRGEADMAVYLTGNAAAGEQPLANEQLFYLSASPPGRPRKTIALADLGAERLVLPAPGNPLRDFLDAAARAHGLAFDVVLEVDGVGSRRNAVLKGIGGTIIGAHAVSGSEPGDGLAVREIVGPRLFRPIYVGARPQFDPALRERMSGLLAATLGDLGLAPAEGG